MTFNIITAFTKYTHGIGINGKLPFDNKKDLKYFSTITKNSTIIMGRLTWESLHYKPLKGRTNIVITSREGGDINGVEYFKTLDEALQKYTFNVFVIGGERLYREALLREDCKYVYTTIIDIDTDCNVFFPNDILVNNYHIKSSNEYDECQFIVWDRK